MPTLSTAELATLHAELQGAAYTGLTDAQRLDAIHVRGTSPNPVATAPQVAKPFTFSDVIGSLSAASLLNIRGMADRGNLIDAINNQDRPNVGRWVAILSISPALIQPTEATAVNAILTATIPDPAWSATVPGPSRKAALFGAKSWTRPDNSVVDYIPLEDVTGAR